MPDVEGRIVLGLDIANTTQQISQELDGILKSIGEKRIKLNAKIDNIDLGNASSQIKNVTDRINQEFNKSSQSVKQSFQNSTKSVNDFARKVEEVQNALASNKIEATLAGVNSKFNQLSATGHEKLSQIQTDLDKLNSLQRTMSTSSDSKVLVSSYNEYSQVLARVKNNLSLVSVETKSLAQEQNTLARSMTLSSKMDSWMNQNVKAVERYGAQIKALQSSLNNNKNAATLTNVSAEFSKIQAQAKAAGLTTNQFAQSLKNTALQAVGLGSALAVINKITSIITDAVNAVIELDTALVDLQKTTSMSGSQMAQFYKDANVAAKELGVTTKDIIQSAADWSRMGYSDKTSSEMMARLSAQFAAISPGADINQATTGLLSTMKAYGIEVEDVLDGIMSKINIVGNTAGTSNVEILTGLSKSAAAMAAMNSSLDENIALFTAAQEIVQNDSQVGNAIRSISLRVRGYDEETEQLSEELSNITGEVVELTKTAQHAEGVSLFTDESQEHYKSIYTYLKDISEIYDELSEKQQQQLMEKLFGKNRSNVGQAILKNFQAAEDAMNNMANSAGNADAEMEVITSSLEFKLNALRETSVGIFQDMFPREDIAAAVDALTGLLNIIGQITSFLGPMGTALAGAGIFAFVKNLD